VTITASTALATLTVAVVLLLTGGGAPGAAANPRASHAPTHYSRSFAGLFPARDVWGQYERTP
jgi:hypothetical protein